MAIKKLHRVLMFLVLSLMLALPGYSAGSSVTQAVANIADVSGSPNFRTLTFSFTADDSDGSVPATASSATNTTYIQGWFIIAVITDPGATAPTDDYDITLTYSGLDLMGGNLANRDTANTEIAYPASNAPVLGAITFTLTNNLVNSAVGDVIVIFAKQP